MPKITRILQGTSLALTMTAMSATAAMIDFSSPDWSAAAGNASHTVNGVTATASALLTLPPILGTPKLSHSSGGLGVNYGDWFNGNDDEIDNTERLSIDLGAAAYIEKIVVHKLFTNECLGFFCYDERGKYRLDGGSWQSFSAISSVEPGMLAIMVGASAQTIDFKADRLFKDDFSLKAIHTPEPGTLALLGLGLAGIGAIRRRKTA